MGCLSALRQDPSPRPLCTGPCITVTKLKRFMYYLPRFPSLVDKLRPCCRQSLGNGTLYFPPFRAEDYRKDVHATVYRCRAANLAGTIISRDVKVKAGKWSATR